ncbi:MAG: hypothetical protein LZF62_100026 [Nitrospira sp.]|nr:MAG: hypothetical protein LZF62_100026 [Nitrospira sp.]
MALKLVILPSSERETQGEQRTETTQKTEE